MKPSSSLLSSLSRTKFASNSSKPAQRILNLEPRPSHPIVDGNAIRHGISIVRKVLNDNPSEHGWRTQEIYQLALKEPSPEGFQCVLPNGRFPVPPPHLEHPVRSKRFLKDILSHLEGYNDIKLVVDERMKADGSSFKTFVWKLVDKSKLPQPKAEVVRGPTVSLAVGGHEDWSHLNTRRKRSRHAKILAMVTKHKGADVSFMQPA